MRTLWHAVVSAFSTFSVLPTPRIEWRADSLRGILGALPLVGVVIGGFGCLYFWLSGLLGLPIVLNAAVLTVLPIAVSGGIHMDGFADTVDALSSHAEPEKKRAILKDPHAGAFAILGVGCYLLLCFGLCAALPQTWNAMLLLGLSHVLARAIGSLLGTVLPTSAQEGMLKTFRDAAKKATVLILIGWIALALALAALLSPLTAALFAACGAAVFFFVKHTASKQFCGMSGDLSGFGISLASIALLFGLVLAERVAAIWF